jgi:beta-N-acetylhexosaminidase
MPPELSRTCGQLVVGGFQGVTLPASYSRALTRGERGGAVIFKRNVPADVVGIAALTGEIARATGGDAPPLVAIDQEGGRVARLGPPALVLPPMLTIASLADLDLAERLAHAQAVELRALGVTMNFSPVLDVNVCAENPVIGDRAFGDDAATVSTFGEAWIRGLRSGGVLSCAKHFPGHGDTMKDSHFDLPRVTAPRERLDAVELPPFAAAARADVDSMMSAHVVYDALDDSQPATLSARICTALLRETIGFRGVLFSDDLEMKAISDRYGIEDATVGAIRAGCDAVLLCASEELQDRAHAALVRCAQGDGEFRARVEASADRLLAMRRRSPPPRAGAVGDVASRAIADELSRRLEAQ